MQSGSVPSIAPLALWSVVLHAVDIGTFCGEDTQPLSLQIHCCGSFIFAARIFPLQRPFSFSSGSPGTVVLHVGPGLHPAPGSSGLRARRQRHMSRVAAKRASCCSRRGGAGGAAQWHARRIAKQERKTCVQVARTGFQASSVYRVLPKGNAGGRATPSPARHEHN